MFQGKFEQIDTTMSKHSKKKQSSQRNLKEKIFILTLFNDTHVVWVEQLTKLVNNTINIFSINPNISYYRRATRGRRGGGFPCPFLKFKEKCPNFGKKCPN